MSYSKIRSDIKDLTDEKFRLVAHAQARGRETNSKEDILIAEFDGAIEALKKELEGPEQALTVQQNGPLGGQTLVGWQPLGAGNSGSGSQECQTRTFGLMPNKLFLIGQA